MFLDPYSIHLFAIPVCQEELPLRLVTIIYKGRGQRLINQGAEAPLQNDKPAAQHKAKLLQWQQRMRLPTGSDDDIK